MEDKNQQEGIEEPAQTPATDGSMVVATPSSIVPPSSAIPQPAAYAIPPLPKKTVTLESLDASKFKAPQSAISNQQSDNQIIQQSTTDDQRQTTNDSLELPDLSPEAIEFLTSDRYQQSSQMLRRELAISEDDISFLGEMDHAAFGKLIDISQYIQALLGEFPHLNVDEKKKLIGILIAYRYLPFSSSFKPTPEEAANRAGISLPVAPYYRIYSKPLTYRGAAHEIARMAGVELMGQTQERLRDLVISKLKGIRTSAQIEEQLVRTAELGGMGLNEEKARAVRESMEDILGRAQIITEEEYSRQLNREIHERHVLEKTTESSAIPKTPLAEEEEKEIKAIAARMPRTEQEVSPILAASVHAVLDRLSWKPEDGYLRRRLESAISMRLRGMRSRNELFMKLMRDDKVGGMGLDRTDADRLASEIETACEEFRTQVLNEEKQKILTEQEIQRKKIEERKKREAEEHARWYQEKIKSRSPGSAGAGSGSDMNPLERLKAMVKNAGLTSPIHPIDAKEQAKERTQFGELVTALNAAKASKAQGQASTVFAAIAPASAQAVAADQSPAGGNTVPGTETRPIPERTVPVQHVVKVSAETARMKEKAPMNLRPKVEDVQPPVNGSRGLVGPVQEIGNITLDRFRRLAPKPLDAVNRIRALIDLLSEESFEKRVMGIQAWRSCPLQKQYLGLVAKAFSSRLPVNVVADQLRIKGEEVLTAEEISAIVTLNGELKL